MNPLFGRISGLAGLHKFMLEEDHLTNKTLNIPPERTLVPQHSRPPVP
jgi:hypothetical protein